MSSTADAPLRPDENDGNADWLKKLGRPAPNPQRPKPK